MTKNISQKERKKLYKQKCRELGGFINVAYEDGKYLLNDINISPSNKFRLLYLATYIRYNDNTLYIKEKGKYVPMKIKDMKSIMNLSETGFYDFLKEIRNKGLIIEKDGIFKISDKYFNKGKKRNKSLKIFIGSMRELYILVDARNHKVIFNILKLTPLSTNNYINIKDIVEYSRHIYEVLNEIILKTEKLLITNKELGKIKINEMLINKKSVFEDMGLGYGGLIYSKGEEKIADFLHEYEIDFIKEKEFDGLIGLGGDPLRYDFYLPNFNLLIEFHGQQHKEFTPFFHRTKRDFKIQKTHDKMKMKYAYDNDIDILIIWYYSYEDIEYILYQHLFN